MSETLKESTNRIYNFLESKNKDGFNFSERKKQFYASSIPKVEFDVVTSHRASSNANSNSKDSLPSKKLISYFSIFEGSNTKAKKKGEDLKVAILSYSLENLNQKR